MTPSAKAQRGPRGARNHGKQLGDWRRHSRLELLRSAAIRTTRRPWSANLLHALVEELYVEDDVVALLGEIDQIPLERYPQAVIVALAVRHSWRPDDFNGLARRLRLPTSFRGKP